MKIWKNPHKDIAVTRAFVADECAAVSATGSGCRGWVSHPENIGHHRASPARVILEQDVFKDRSHRDPSLRSRMTRWEGRNVRKRRREGSRAEEKCKKYIKPVGANCVRPQYRSPIFFLKRSSWAEHGDIVNERGTKQQTRVESNLFSTVLGEKRRTSSLPAQWGIYKKVICNPTRHKMLLLCQKDNINRSRSRKLSWQFSLLLELAILSLALPKVRLSSGWHVLICFVRTPNKRATAGRPYRQREKPLLSVTDQTKISKSLFTIKKKPVVACCPRVSTSLLN